MHFSSCDDERQHHPFSPEQTATNVMSTPPRPLSNLDQTHQDPIDPHSMSIDDHLRSMPSPPPTLPPHTSTNSTHPSNMQWAAQISYRHQNPSTSMLDTVGYGSLQTGSAACQQVDQMLIRMHSSSASSSATSPVNISEMSGLPGSHHQLKNEPIDPSYPLSSLGGMGMPGFEMLPSPYPSSSRSHSDGSLLLPQHLRRPRASVDGFHRCPHCPKKLSTLEQLHEHMAECKLERVHQCTQCEKRFKARGGLQQHMRIHDDIKPFKCEYCQKRFTQKSHIDQHLRIHTGLKPFTCRYCGRQFRQRSQQLGHENTHFAASGRLVNIPLQMPSASGEEPALNLSQQHSPHSGQSSPITTTVPSPYAAIPSTASSDIVSLLGMPGTSSQINVPPTTF